MSREYREERLERVLQEQLYENLTGTQEAVIVTNDGLIVAAYPGVGEGQNVHNEVGGSHWIAALAAEVAALTNMLIGATAALTARLTAPMPTASPAPALTSDPKLALDLLTAP